DAILRSQATLASELVGLPVEPEEHEARTANRPPSSKEDLSEIDQARWPVLAATLRNALGTTARLFKGDKDDLIVEVHHDGQPLRLIVGPATRWQNTYVAGDLLAVSPDARSFPRDQAGRRTMLDVARLLIEHEHELIQADPRPRSDGMNLNPDDGTVYLPIGKLTPLRTLRAQLPASDQSYIREDIGILFLTSPCFA